MALLVRRFFGKFIFLYFHLVRKLFLVLLKKKVFCSSEQQKNGVKIVRYARASIFIQLCKHKIEYDLSHYR